MPAFPASPLPARPPARPPATQVSLFFSEMPTNPYMRCVDVPLISRLCHKKVSGQAVRAGRLHMSSLVVEQGAVKTIASTCAVAHQLHMQQDNHI